MNRRGREMHFDFGRLSLSLLLLILQSASADNIVSRPVGFLRVAVPPNAPILASRPFSALDQSNAVMAEVLKWDVSSGYTSSATSAKPGEGFWLVNKQSTNQIVFLAGEVALSPSNTALLYPGLNLVGYPYSGPVRLDETELWELTNSVQILNAGAEEPNPAESAMGKGYWVKSLSEECIVWTEIRPYENVFPASGLPDIKAITTEDGLRVVLSIDCEGAELLDVFYQDVTPTSHFESSQNWKLAETDLRANGHTAIEWTDTGGCDREAPGKVVARYYLVGRADIDLNGNGVPDAREQFVMGMHAVGGGLSGLMDGGNAVQDGYLFGDSAFIQANTNAPAEGRTNLVESSRPIFLGGVIYVDQRVGQDTYSGRSSIVAAADGPKKTICGGFNEARSGDALVIKEGRYSEGLNVAGKGVRVRFRGKVRILGLCHPEPASLSAQRPDVPHVVANAPGVP